MTKSDTTKTLKPHSDDRAASDGTPLDAVVFAGLMQSFAPFETAPYLAVAVSGGADSMVLALLAHQWVCARGGKIVAMTVDHGLRGDSASEAKWVSQQLQAQGIAHIVLPWVGQKPSGAVQEQARIARYGLLDQACEQRGIFHLLVAHHQDDQSETIAMRHTHGSKPMGRAGMSARRFLKTTRVLRPFLSVAKVDLIATLNAHGQDWIEDPSNQNPKFERVRIRQNPEQLADLGSTADFGQKNAQSDAAQTRQVIEGQLAGLLARSVMILPVGVAVVDMNEVLSCQDADISCYALGQIIRTIGGAVYMPSFEALTSLWNDLQTDASPRISLGGCILHRKAGRLYIYREVGRMDQTPLVVDPNVLRSGGCLWWDHRFEWAVLPSKIDAASGLFIGPLMLCDVFHTKAFRAAFGEFVAFIADLPRAALASMPALYDKEGLLSLGGLEVSELSDVLSAAGCAMPRGRGEYGIDGRWRFAPRTPLWESGFRSLPNPVSLLA